MRVIFATGNKGKLKEIREILADADAEVISLKETGIISEPEENGSTFVENALIKVKDVFLKLKELDDNDDTIIMADDSGLCIDAFDGGPGVHSARFLGHDTDYNYKNSYILNELKDVPEEKRGAAFVCSIAAVTPDGAEFTTEGRMEGIIGYEIKGEGGFGYDPIFFLPEYGKTSGELSLEEKNGISHRGRALRRMKEVLLSAGYLKQRQYPD